MTTPQPQFLNEEKSLACVHCGLCLGACPTYLETGNENESPRGRIYIMRALQAGRLPLDSASVQHIDLCLGCRACEVACPSGVQYGALLEETRDFIEEHHARSAYQSFLRRFVIERIFPVPWRMKLALVPAALAKTLRLDKLLPAGLREPLSLVPTRMSPDKTPEFSPATVQPAKGRVGFIRGCVMSVMFGDTNAASVRLLNELGFDVVSPREQVCCGALFAHSGRMKLAREHAARNIAVFAKEKLDAIIINAAGCGSTLKEYGNLLESDPTLKKPAFEFAHKVRDITEFLTDHAFAKRQFRPSTDRVTYHDACHLAHPQRITKQPRELVRAVAGPNYVELPEADVCCGSAGTYNLTEPEMAERLQQRKIQNILSTGATTVVTSNPGCIMQIRSGLEKAAPTKIRVLHIADFLLEASRGQNAQLKV
ncbi:MAG TPA: (Fe-S)-binding protein [Verrucomicrobiae bacterium]|nr:(Fe-S)-binding protein [Verrucomicrobiae bacterium]